MRRRDFIPLVVGLLSGPITGYAQQPTKTRRVGVLTGIAESDSETPLRIAALKKGLQENGFGDTVKLDIRAGAGGSDQLQAHAAELVALQPDVLFAGNTAALAALHRQTRTLPIVFAQVTDPVANGFVASLSRPGGNITGFTNFEESMPGKWLELLRGLAPSVNSVGFIYDVANPAGAHAAQLLKTSAPALSIHVVEAPVRDRATIENAIVSLAQHENAGLVVLGSPATAANRDRIIALAQAHRLPAIYPYRYFVASGGLASYGVDTADLYRRAAGYIGRVLKGEKPAELPVQQPNKFELVINLKTARAYGLQVPDKLLALADEVIE